MTTTSTPETAPSVPVRLDFDSHAAGQIFGADALVGPGDYVYEAIGLRELMRVRASQLNGCAYCVDMHGKDARAVGESEHRLYALPVWATSTRGTRSATRRASCTSR